MFVGPRRINILAEQHETGPYFPVRLPLRGTLQESDSQATHTCEGAGSSTLARPQGGTLLMAFLMWMGAPFEGRSKKRGLHTVLGNFQVF